jgi:predicted MFS family arabinose efflux permease
LAPSYALLMMARIAAGVFGGVLSALCQTIVGDVIPFERRGRAMGIVMTSFSVSTVAGVPLGLFLAAHFSWHAPFFGIAALCAVLALLAAATLPRLEGHLGGHPASAFGGLAQVLSDRNHQRAFLFSGLMMFAGFTVIPYITLYMTANAGLRQDQIPYIYLCGGVVTLFTARLVGRLTDRHGKVPTFRWLALINIVPMLAVTMVGGLPLAGVLVVTTLFFMFMSGRMIPGMAILTSAAQPRLRGTFMTLNASMQSAALGLASFIGGQLISRDAHGLVTGYWQAAVVGAVAALASIWLAPRLALHGAPPSALPAVAEAKT